jgi:glycolate oxidase iron-sulfur subunit
MSETLSDLISEAERCVACGLCLPHCPTYQKTGSEADSPRGRIQLMRAVAQDILPNNDRFKTHIDLCLSCRSCESACPNNVQYGKLADITRCLLMPKKSWSYRIAKPFIRYRTLQYVLGNSMWLTQQLKLNKLLARLMPLSQKVGLITRPKHWKNTYLAPSNANIQFTPLKTIQLFLGCASNGFDQQTLQAAVYVCNQLGINVVIPPMQTCCGSIARQMGDSETSETMVLKNIQAFDANMPIVSIASGCGAGLKDYLPKHKILDIHSFLAECDWSQVSLIPLHATIHVQDPCTLRNTLKGTSAVYKILNHIPQTHVLPLPNNSHCCGGAGAYMLTQPKMANSLREDKIKTIIDHNVSILATANIGCGLHIANGLREQSHNVRVIHPLQIIATQMGFKG